MCDLDSVLTFLQLCPHNSLWSNVFIVCKTLPLLKPFDLPLIAILTYSVRANTMEIESIDMSHGVSRELCDTSPRNSWKLGTCTRSHPLEAREQHTPICEHRRWSNPDLNSGQLLDYWQHTVAKVGWMKNPKMTDYLLYSSHRCRVNRVWCTRTLPSL
jgi:hypothetical protein